MKGTLAQHLEVLAHDPRTFASRACVEPAIVERVLAGLPIPGPDAAKITRYLSQRFGHPHNAKDEYQIDGLKAV